MAPKTYVTVPESADRLTKRPDFPRAYIFGGARRWDQEEVEEWIEAQRQAPDGRRVRHEEELATTP